MDTKRLQLALSALKESLAQKVSGYEEQIAFLRAEATIEIENRDSKIIELTNELARLKGEGNEDVPKED